MKYTVICEECGKRFESNSRNDRFCSDVCRRIVNKRNHASKKHAFKSINQIVREIDEYNKTHGKHLSYGQYVSGRR